MTKIIIDNLDTFKNSILKLSFAGKINECKQNVKRRNNIVESKSRPPPPPLEIEKEILTKERMQKAYPPSKINADFV